MVHLRFQISDLVLVDHSDQVGSPTHRASSHADYSMLKACASI
jgi:hypothetical protein